MQYVVGTIDTVTRSSIRRKLSRNTPPSQPQLCPTALRKCDSFLATTQPCAVLCCSVSSSHSLQLALPRLISLVVSGATLLLFLPSYQPSDTLTNSCSEMKCLTHLWPPSRTLCGGSKLKCISHRLALRRPASPQSQNRYSVGAPLCSQPLRHCPGAFRVSATNEWFNGALLARAPSCGKKCKNNTGLLRGQTRKPQYSQVSVSLQFTSNIAHISTDHN